MKREMTPRERILNSINHKPVDHLPTDLWCVDEINIKLFKHFNVKSEFELANALDLDKIIHVSPAFIADRANMWGIKERKISLPSNEGYYYEQESFPLADYDTIDEIDANYIFPSTDMFDYSTIKQQIEQTNGEYAIEGGYISLLYFYEIIRGTEQMLMDFIINPEVAKYILFKLQEFSVAHVKNILEAGNGRIDITQVTDDFGSQNGLLMSPKMLDEYLGAYYSENIEQAKRFGAKIFHHDDGAMTEMIPWLMEKGIEVLNPLQWHLSGWDLQALKEQYTGSLCFHGGIDNQHVLAFGTTEEVRTEVRTCAEILFADNTGYILAPCHNIQAITSVENILAMYDEAKKF